MKPQKGAGNFFIWLFVILGMLYVFNALNQGVEKPVQELTYSQFFGMVKENLLAQKIATAIKTDNIIKGELAGGEKFVVNIPEGDQDLIRALRENVKNFDIKPPKTLWVNLFYSLGPMVLFILFLWLFAYRSPGGAGGGKIWAFSKSRATLASDQNLKITFADVAGVDEAKEELKEVIEFLKDPRKFQRLGGKIPKGVLLMGHPGTGKTLLAKAVAGEANVPFLSISGSDFVEMFVGVGASRVRDLFDQAKRSAKTSGRGAIIFIDEIDAVGRQRFAGIGGGHDEREQTLNALLVEMDGFNTQEGVILIAATNRPDVLDPALLRPGRFDRQIVIDMPDIVGREAILKVHAKNVKLDPAVNLKTIARQTPGFSGADLANLVNEAALLAARRNNEHVTMSELQEAMERVMAGPERKSKVISKPEKEIISYHESGHALLALLIPGADPLHKVSILPRGMALGYTIRLPLEDRYIVSKTELMGRISGLLGGRVSEDIVFHEVSTGAQNDLEVATGLARKMVTRFGMSEKLGHITFGHKEEQVFLGRDLIEERNYSDQTALLIDQEVRKIVDDCYERAKNELLKHQDKLKMLAERLLEKEIMEVDEIKILLGFDIDQKKDI
ncbi:MAG: ATP-dependent zinc metalloprotease FtsH [Candidatus Omnitrophica bacterium]|nr:ATP-dependent zinc metalloprotease FtsH [Candidatus Omnitrophota bacterium]MDD5436052.1 ATP-dependent zinc metalloprotease FtsH [Candidatus Omnitrophota bacterium]